MLVLILQEAFVTSDEFGQDLEHVEVLQKKFDEFQKVIFYCIIVLVTYLLQIISL